MEVSKEMKVAAKGYDTDYLNKLKDASTGLQMMVMNKVLETEVGALDVPSGIVNIQALLNTGLANEADYYLNHRPPNVLHYIEYDSYRGVLKLKNTGMPLWYQLEGEASVFYNMFEAYRDLLKVEGKPRDFRSVAKLFDIKMAKVGRVSAIFHWDLRIKAFEHFNEITRMRVRREEAFAMEERHSSEVVEYIDKVMSRIRAFDEEDLKQINPKTAVSILKELQEMERLSRGVDPKKVSKITSPTTRIQNEEEKQNSNVTINQINSPNNNGNGFGDEVKTEKEQKKEEEILRAKTKKAREITKVLDKIMPSEEEAAEEEKKDAEELKETIKELKRKRKERDDD